MALLLEDGGKKISSVPSPFIFFSLLSAAAATAV